MGFQNGNDNSQFAANLAAQSKSQQRTSVTAKEANNTTKAQYERLSKTGKMEGE